MLWLAACAFIVCFRFYLGSGQTLWAWPGAGHDDGLFLELAESIAAGHWLGTYNQFTLMKGIFFPLFIAANHLLGVPLLLARELLYAIACAVAVVALSPILRGPWQRLAIFALLLFNPISFSIDRILREQIYAALTLLVIACALAIWLRIGSAARALLPWFIGLGLALGAFWLTREEGVWILPLLIFLYLAAAAQYWRERRSWKEFSVLFSLPLLIWGGSLFAVSSLNYAYYKIFVTVEMREPGFVAAYGALSRIRHKVWHPIVPIPSEVRLQAYRYSPAFAELRPFLEGEMAKRFVPAHFSMPGQGDWIALFLGPAYNPLLRIRFNSYFGISLPQNGADAWVFLRERYATDPVFAGRLQTLFGGKLLTEEWLNPTTHDEIEGGWLMWALRDAAFFTGHYTDGAEASRFYRRVAEEVNAACASGQLDCLPERNTLMPPWNSAYWEPLWQRIATGIPFLISLEGASVYSLPSIGEPLQLRAAADFTGDNVLIPQYQIQGWAWGHGEPLALDVVDSEGRSWVSASETNLPSADVYEYFLKQGIAANEARQARFNITTWCIERCSLLVRRDGKKLGEIPLSGAPTTAGGDEFRAAIGSYRIENATVADARRSWWKLTVLDSIDKAYQLIFPWLFAASLIAYAALSFLAIASLAVRKTWLVLSILLALILDRVLILSLITVTSFAGITTQYLSPLYPLLMLFAAIALAGVADRSVWNRLTRRLPQS